jgi:hypothetical protein
MRFLLRNIHIRICSKALAVAMSFTKITCCPHLCASAMGGASGSDITDSPIYIDNINLSRSHAFVASCPTYEKELEQMWINLYKLIQYKN